MTLFLHRFYQRLIFRKMFFLILTLPGSFYTPLHINSCFKSVIKIVGESATFDQKKKISKKKIPKISAWFRYRYLCCLLQYPFLEYLLLPLKNYLFLGLKLSTSLINLGYITLWNTNETSHILIGKFPITDIRTLLGLLLVKFI